MKRSLFFILFSVIITTSVYSHEKDSVKMQQNSIGVFFSPFMITEWYYPGYTLIPDDQGHGFITDNYHRSIILNSIPGIYYRYQVNPLIGFQISLFTNKESKKIEYLHFGNLEKDVNYRMDYLNIPLSLVFFSGHHLSEKGAKGGFYIKVGASFDFVTREEITSTTHSRIDNHFSYYYGSDPYYKVEESNSRKIKFNRICPLISMGQEIAGNHFSIFYDFNLQFPSMYQKQNTLECFKTFKFSLISTGISYHF